MNQVKNVVPLSHGCQECLKSGDSWDDQLGEFIIKYEDVRAAETPEKALLSLTYWQTTGISHRPSGSRASADPPGCTNS
jgi:hypothetical protein